MSNFLRANDLLIIVNLPSRGPRRPISIVIGGQVVIVVQMMADPAISALFLTGPVANLLVLHVSMIDENLDNKVLSKNELLPLNQRGEKGRHTEVAIVLIARVAFAACRVS